MAKKEITVWIGTNLWLDDDETLESFLKGVRDGTQCWEHTTFLKVTEGHTKGGTELYNDKY